MNKGAVYVAIDPGKAGGFAVRHPDGSTSLYAMPETETVVAELVRKVISAAHAKGNLVEAFMERVGGFVGKRQPGSAMFTFGRGVGVLVGLLLAHHVPFREVAPQAWLKAVSAGTASRFASKSAWKRHLLDLARKRHPVVKGLTLATCDALLLLDAVASPISFLPTTHTDFRPKAESGRVTEENGSKPMKTTSERRSQ